MPVTGPNGWPVPGTTLDVAESVVEVPLGELTFPVRTAGLDNHETVIFLHGFPQTSAMWSPYLARLSAAGVGAVAADQRGYAATARPTDVDQYGLDLLVADVLGIADGLGIEGFHLVGHDWGGLVGWALAAAHPDRLRSLTSVSTPHPRAFASSLWRSSQLGRSWYLGLFQVPQVPERLLTLRDGTLLRRMLRGTGLPAASAAGCVEAMLRPGALAAAISYYRALTPRRAAAVGSITVPTLYVWGTNDIALGPVAARATAAQVEGPYRFEVMDGAGHWIPDTRIDELTDLILQHVRAIPASPA